MKMNNNEKKFSLENFKKNVKLHKVKFVLNFVFIVLSISLLIILSVFSLSDKNSNTASALSNDSRAYLYSEFDPSSYSDKHSYTASALSNDSRAFQYPEFDPSSNIYINSQSPYYIPFFVPVTFTNSCCAFISILESSSSTRVIYISSIHFIRVSPDSAVLRYNGKYLDTGAPINSGPLVSLTKDGDNFRCIAPFRAYCAILANPSYTSGNRFLYHLLPQIPVFNTIYNNGVSDGYDSGYDSGLHTGYDSGFSSGYNTALTDGLKNPVSFIIDPVREFLNAPLFGVVSVGSVLTVALFVLVAIMFIKMFAGG
jgi:hypothetical protein